MATFDVIFSQTELKPDFQYNKHLVRRLVCTFYLSKIWNFFKHIRTFAQSTESWKKKEILEERLAGLPARAHPTPPPKTLAKDLKIKSDARKK